MRVGKQTGFTIVELLVVIVVIAILAAITVVAYNGIQARSRDAQRQQDLKSIQKALEMYYVDKGEFPQVTNSVSTINQQWSTTSDASWTDTTSNGNDTFRSLGAALVPKYLSKLPTDPTPQQGASPLGTRYGYAYWTGAACGRPSRQVYWLTYWNEASAQQDTLIGTCASGAIGPYGASEIQVVK